MNGVNFSIETVETPSKSVNDRVVYQYVKVNKTAIKDESITNSVINFRVPKTWLSSKNIDSKTVKLYGLEDGKWKNLPTEQIETDSDYVYYESNSTKLGTFGNNGT